MHLPFPTQVICSEFLVRGRAGIHISVGPTPGLPHYPAAPCNTFLNSKSINNEIFYMFRNYYVPGLFWELDIKLKSFKLHSSLMKLDPNVNLKSRSREQCEAKVTRLIRANAKSPARQLDLP